MKFYLPLVLFLVTSWLNGPPILYLIYIILFWVLDKLENKKNEEDEIKE